MDVFTILCYAKYLSDIDPNLAVLPSDVCVLSSKFIYKNGRKHVGLVQRQESEFNVDSLRLLVELLIELCLQLYCNSTCFYMYI